MVMGFAIPLAQDCLQHGCPFSHAAMVLCGSWLKGRVAFFVSDVQE
jgi:hypothetical protein